MKTVADFKREATPGSVWRSDHKLRPGASGIRRVIGGKTVLSYAFENVDGKTGTNGRLEFPKASEARFEGDSVYFLDGPGGNVMFVWTKERG